MGIKLLWQKLFPEEERNYRNIVLLASLVSVGMTPCKNNICSFLIVYESDLFGRFW